MPARSGAVCFSHEGARVTQSVRSRRRSSAGTSAPRTDFIDDLRELCIVFRAESGISCRTGLDIGSVHCDAAVGDAIRRSVGVLFAHVSKRARATAVTVTADAQADGAVLVRVDVEEAVSASAEPIPPAARSRLHALQVRLLALGVQMDLDRDLLRASFVVPAEHAARADVDFRRGGST
jgi:hypothetical protein